MQAAILFSNLFNKRIFITPALPPSTHKKGVYFKKGIWATDFLDYFLAF